MCINEIVSPYQTGFIPNRNIHENIVASHEMIHRMNILKGKNKKRGYFAIKIDLAKAYDMMSWSFMNNVLIEVGLPDNKRPIIMEAISLWRSFMNNDE